MPIHIKKIGFVLLALLIILAGFYRSLEQDSSSVKRLAAPLADHEFEKNQCVTHEIFWQNKASSRYEFLRSLWQQWEGPVVIESLRLNDDLWEITLIAESEAMITEMPGWFLEKADLIQLQSCRSGKGCIYKCCVFL